MSRDRSNRTYVPTTFPAGIGTGKETDIRIDVFHDRGGPNYFTGGTIRAGYWVSVGAVERRDGCVSEVLGGGGFGRRILALETRAPFNPKRFAHLAAEIHQHDATIAQAALDGDYEGIRVLAMSCALVAFPPAKAKPAPAIAPVSEVQANG